MSRSARIARSAAVISHQKRAVPWCPIARTARKAERALHEPNRAGQRDHGGTGGHEAPCQDRAIFKGADHGENERGNGKLAGFHAEIE